MSFGIHTIIVNGEITLMISCPELTTVTVHKILHSNKIFLLTSNDDSVYAKNMKRSSSYNSIQETSSRLMLGKEVINNLINHTDTYSRLDQ